MPLYQVYEQAMPVRISGDDHKANLIPVYVVSAPDAEAALKHACKRAFPEHPVISEVRQ